MKTARRLITVIVFVAFLIAGFVTVVILPKDENSAKEENRNLAEMPQFSFERLKNGEFTSEFETFLSDNVGYRSVFTGLSSAYKSGRGINKFGKVVDTKGDLGTGSTTQNQLLVTDDRVMEVYHIDDDARREYIDMVNFYADKLPQGINLYAMIIPTQIDFIPFYNTVGDSEKDSINYFYDNFSDRVKNINVYDTLKENFDKGEYDYFRTDHHWTQLGAYRAYSKMGEVMGFEAQPLESFTKGEVKEFRGYLFSQAQATYLEEHTDTIEYYKNAVNDIEFKAVTYSYIPGQEFDYSGKMFDLSKGASYTMFLGGDQPYIEIDTACPTARTLVMLKDSYSNALIPWLACSYNKIIVVDARTYDQTITKLLNSVPINDFLITNYIMGTNFRDYIEMCRAIYD